MLQARLRFRHRGCFSERLRGAPRILHLGSDGDACVALLTDADPKLLDAFVAHGQGAVIDRSPTSVALRCACPQGGVVGGIQRRGGVVLWPILQRDGLEFLDVLAPSREVLRGVVGDLQKLGHVDVERVSDAAGSSMGIVVRLPDITAALSRRQLDVLRVAIEGGYYENPRRTSTRELAAQMRLSPSTFQEHLRKAQAAVMNRFGRIVTTHPGLLAAATKGRGRPKNNHAGTGISSGSLRVSSRP